MPPEDNSESIAGLEKKVDALSKDIANILKSLESLLTIPEISKKLDALGKETDGIGAKVSNLPKIEGIVKAIDSVGSKVEERSTSKEIESLESIISEVGAQVKKVDDGIGEIRTSKETEVLFKKIDDLLIAVKDVDENLKEVGKAEELGSINEKVEGLAGTLTNLSTTVEEARDSDTTDVIGKKIDDLQQYVAGLSALEEKVDDIAQSFIETKEIVGIIVRQLDDIERKYNKAADEIIEAAEMLKSGAPAVSEPSGKKTSSKTTSKGKDEDVVLEASTTTVDELMNGLLAKVRPQTEAKVMAKLLEDVRDQLTTMITGHTPVLFQFGKRARELKSYPPTATLNENDIARLNKELRDWTSKLKKIASE